MKLKDLKKIVARSVQSALLEAYSLKESNLTELQPLVDLIQSEVPGIMKKFEHQITKDVLMKQLGIPMRNYELVDRVSHLLTDPDNTGGLKYYWAGSKYNEAGDSQKQWLLLSNDEEDLTDDKEEDMYNTMLGLEPKHQLVAPGEFDKTEFGAPPGTSMDPDYETEFGLYDPATVGKPGQREDDTDEYKEKGSTFHLRTKTPKKLNLKENELSQETGADKMDRAVDVAIDAGLTLSRMSKGERSAGDGDRVRSSAIEKMISIFLDEEGNLSDPDIDPTSLSYDMEQLVKERLDYTEENSMALSLIQSILHAVGDKLSDKYWSLAEGRNRKHSFFTILK